MKKTEGTTTSYCCGSGVKEAVDFGDDYTFSVQSDIRTFSGLFRVIHRIMRNREDAEVGGQGQTLSLEKTRRI